MLAWQKCIHKSCRIERLKCMVCTPGIHQISAPTPVLPTENCSFKSLWSTQSYDFNIAKKSTRLLSIRYNTGFRFQRRVEHTLLLSVWTTLSSVLCLPLSCEISSSECIHRPRATTDTTVHATETRLIVTRQPLLIELLSSDFTIVSWILKNCEMQVFARQY